VVCGAWLNPREPVVSTYEKADYVNGRVLDQQTTWLLCAAVWKAALGQEEVSAHSVPLTPLYSFQGILCQNCMHLHLPGALYDNHCYEESKMSLLVRCMVKYLKNTASMCCIPVAVSHLLASRSLSHPSGRYIY
jgi:hypothetical protein